MRVFPSEPRSIRFATYSVVLHFLAALTLIPSSAIARSTCDELQSIALSNAIVLSSTDIPAGSLKDRIPGESAEVPAFCRIALRVEPQIYIEVWLPHDSWNGRFQAEGNGAYAGSVNYFSLVEALRAGYATASTDTGHPFYMGGSFAMKADGELNWELIEDFAWRSVFEMVRKAKILIKAYYGTQSKYSYWNGCSTGGRQGLAAVQRFPEEFDGVLAGSPAISFDRFVPASIWPYITILHETAGHGISAAKFDMATEAAIKACDHLDGVIDGIITDPRKCNYDPSALVCGDNETHPNCLTNGEATAIQKIWEGPKSARSGEQIWFGLERGARLSKFVEQYGNPVDYFKYWIRQDPGFDWRSLTVGELEEDVRSSYKRFNKVIGTDDPNLEAWKRHGGKLMMWQDESDEGIPPRGTQAYFDRVLAVNGGANEVDKFARLYMVPGSGHCGSNERALHPDGIFDALVNWVENGLAPDRIIATQRLEAGSIRTRPLCPYPRTSQWKGRGNSDQAENFTCVDATNLQTLVVR